MTQKKAVDVVIGPQKLTLRTEQDPERVKKIADLVNRRLGEVLPLGQPVSHQVLLLVAMNLAEDLIKHQEEIGRFKTEVKSRSHAILTQLEKEFPL